MTTCYRKANSTVIGDTSNVDGACSLITTSELVSPCCPIKSDSVGSGNLCLSDFLCWESTAPLGGSGFLTASCTDQSYASGECTEHCTDNPVPDVIYNPDTGLWACCGWSYENGVDCAHPTIETWTAPAPQVLLNAASSSSSITWTATSSIASSSSTSTLQTSLDSTTITSTHTLQPISSASSSASSSTTSSGLSTGTKAGIAIGVIALFALIAFCVVFVRFKGRRSRRRHVQAEELSAVPIHELNRTQKSWTQQSDVGSMYRDYNPATELHSNFTNELPANAPARQDGGRSGLAELQ